MIPKISAVVASLLLVLSSCGGSTAPSTDAAGTALVTDTDGEELFKRTVLANNGGCITCHSLTPEKVLVGPPLANIGAAAADRVPGMSARDYLLESIIDPDTFLADGFEAGRMPTKWEEGLSADTIAALVDYMLTLGTE